MHCTQATPTNHGTRAPFFPTGLPFKPGPFVVPLCLSLDLLSRHFSELGRVKGSELVGLKYVPMFDYFADREDSFVVVEDNYVTNESGTGIVHQVRLNTFGGKISKG